MATKNHIADDRKKVRLIDANSLPVTTLTDGEYWTKDVVYKRDIDEAPTVDAVEVVHGRWNNVAGGRTICNKCGEYPLYDYFGRQKFSYYCPNCGAKMDLKVEA